jgi:hypothetical protein
MAIFLRKFDDKLWLQKRFAEQIWANRQISSPSWDSLPPSLQLTNGIPLLGEKIDQPARPNEMKRADGDEMRFTACKIGLDLLHHRRVTPPEQQLIEFVGILLAARRFISQFEH